jgi:hypothetical protein
MSGISPPGTKLDADQVIRRVYDETENKLRVDAEVTAVIGVVEVIIDAAGGDNIAIASADGSNFLTVNPDGSINTNTTVELNAATDSVKVGDGVDTLEINTDGSINTVDAQANAKLTDIDSKLAGTLDTNDTVTQGLLTDVLTQLTSGVTKVDDDQSQVLLSAIDTKLSGTLSVNDSTTQAISSDILTQLTSGTLKVDDDQSQILLNSIDSKLAGTLDTSDTQTHSTLSNIETLLSGNLNVELANEPIKISGTSNGLPGGTEFTLVNNLRQQILAAHDRVANFTYADFGTKNQRITAVEYTSATISTSTIKREFTYTLVGNNYRRDNEIWTII